MQSFALKFPTRQSGIVLVFLSSAHHVSTINWSQADLRLHPPLPCPFQLFGHHITTTTAPTTSSTVANEIVTKMAIAAPVIATTPVTPSAQYTPIAFYPPERSPRWESQQVTSVMLNMAMRSNGSLPQNLWCPHRVPVLVWSPMYHERIATHIN